MNLTKNSLHLLSLVFIISLSSCAVAGTADIIKNQLLQQIKHFQLSQSQSGKTLRKASSSLKEITVADSIQTYTWENSSWKKSACTRYSYDGKGRIKEEIMVDRIEGSDSKNTYEYDSDGRTIKNTSIWNLSIDGEFFMSETTYSHVKYYPEYTNAIIQSNTSEYTPFIDMENSIEFNDLDSVVTITFDGAMDTTFKSFTKYTKISDKIVRSNSTFTSMSDENESVSYHTDYITSGSGGLDTAKCVIHFDGGASSFYKELFSEMQFTMLVSKTNQGHVVEQTVLTAKDSTFKSCMGNIKMSFYTNSKGDIDSLVTQEWDTLQNVWKNSEKAVYSLKKINVSVKKSTNYSQAVQQVTFERKNGTIFLNIPSRITVSELEQFDIKGRLISRMAVTDAKSSIALSLNIKSSRVVNLILLKTNCGKFIYKISPVK
jgi:hypothetical protein